MTVPSVPLGEVATIDRESATPDRIRGRELYVGLENITSNGEFERVSSAGEAGLKSTKFVFTEAHVLYGKLRPYLAKIAAPDFEGICSTDILPIRPGAHLDRRYLLHYLRTPGMVAHAANRAVGINLPRLDPKVLEQFEIPLPPMEEQRRLAAVLDAGEALRAKRRQALAKLDSLTQAIFIDMFGDLLNSTFERIPFGSLLQQPLRNGISPAKSGSVVGVVLTLSAITGSYFEHMELKESTFARAHRKEKTVSPEDFLICRGNGNLSLVGRGKYPDRSMPDVAFPDTMIAARCDPGIVSSGYIARVWNDRVIRGQIERLARTTNGTHKINQSMIESIELPLPPVALQREFDRAEEATISHRADLECAAERLDGLCASLQQRAFRGEL